MPSRLAEDSELVDRVRRLEKEIRVWKRLGAFILPLMTILVLCGSKLLQDTPKVVEAREGFAVVDKDGRYRAYLGYSADGTKVGLSVIDQKGSTRVAVTLHMKDNESGIYVYDKENRARLHIGFNQVDEQYAMHVYDKNDISRLSVGWADKLDVAGMMIRDGREAPRLVVGEKKMPDSSRIFGISSFDQNQCARLQLYTMGDGWPMIQLADEKKLPRIALGVTGGDQKAQFLMRNRGPENRMLIELDPSNSLKFELKDKEDHAINVMTGSR